MSKKTLCLSVLLASVAVNAFALGAPSPTLEKLAVMQADGSENLDHQYDGALAKPGTLAAQGGAGFGASLLKSGQSNIATVAGVPKPGLGKRVVNGVREWWQSGWGPALTLSAGMMTGGFLVMFGVGLAFWAGVAICGGFFAFGVGKAIYKGIQAIAERVRENRRHKRK